VLRFGPRAARRIALIVVVALVATTMLTLGLAGFDVVRALTALLSGAFGSWDAITSGTFVRATPLILTGLAVAVAFQAGVFNIGAEGQFLVGAATATALALALAGWPSPLLVSAVLAGGAAAGAAWAWIAAELRERFHVLEVISTIMLNSVAAYLISYLVRGPLQEPLHIYPQTESIAAAARLPRIFPGTRLHAGFLLACAACVLTWWVIRYTASGFRLRAVGANPDAARSAGQIDVDRVAMRAFLFSGAVAGLAGAIEVTGVTYALYENISPGYGYTAIAVALLARLDAAAVIGTGLAFGALEAGASAMQRDAGVPSVVVSIVEAAVILLLVTVQRVRITGTARP
jgi:simple sugar transport system permease protein